MVHASYWVSHPSWVCGLKLFSDSLFVCCEESHPSWVCGLKLYIYLSNAKGAGSHPSWVCGLKPSVSGRRPEDSVTPFVGVWIETQFLFGIQIRE